MSRLRDALARDAIPRTYAQLTAVGSRTAIGTSLRRGELVRLLPDQYCLAENAESWLMRPHAAVAWAGPGASLSGQAALAAWRYAPLPVDVIDVVVPAGGHRRGPDWLRVRSLTAPFRVVTLAPTTALAAAPLALCLAYGSLPLRDRASFVHGAVNRGIVTVAELEDVLASISRVRCRAELAARLARIAAGAESYLEEVAMTDVLHGPEFADVVFQHRFRVDGLLCRVDALHVATLKAFEMDGGGHGEPAQRQKDVSRDAVLATIGVQPVRYTHHDITTRPAWCRANALQVIETRSRRT